ncbi:hypothetical protein JKF63_05697 [Porcisia hertigi]|uniref:UBC core domain-containing protein n=1 Tax=Porcisia hertigi TaxID=2761500 RepID=A0A836LB27_9TRYP|nr:hypothetical protein JKF63_05697 [Porcisia hertigi]
MASLSSSPHAHSTSNRDYLFRALYLRRELLLLSTRDTAPAPTLGPETKGEGQTSASTSVDPSIHSLHEVLLLPPLYSIDDLSLLPSTDEGSAIDQDPMLRPEHAWGGLVHVRSVSSPWYRGCFAFYVYFPSRYPFEPPIIELAEPLRSHPLLQERRLQYPDQLSSAADVFTDTSSRAVQLDKAVAKASVAIRAAPGRRVSVPFEDVYATIDPMRVSVMTVLIRHMQRMFLPAEWPASWLTPSMEAGNAASHIDADGAVNRVLARRDVERRSVTEEVLLLKPFEQYVGTEVVEHFLNAWKRSESDAGGCMIDTSFSDDADWYTREVLPHLLHS